MDIMPAPNGFKEDKAAVISLLKSNYDWATPSFFGLETFQQS